MFPSGKCMVGIRTQGLCFEHFNNRRCLLDGGNSEKHSQGNWRCGIFLLGSFPGLPIFATRFWLNSRSLPPARPHLVVSVHSLSEHGSQLLVKFCSEVYFFPSPKSQWYYSHSPNCSLKSGFWSWIAIVFSDIRLNVLCALSCLILTRTLLKQEHIWHMKKPRPRDIKWLCPRLHSH